VGLDRHTSTPGEREGGRQREREEGKAGAETVEAAFRGRSVGLGREGACGRGEVSESEAEPVYIFDLR
jgi:hypothetical protein